MDTALVASSTSEFITSFKDILGDNLGLVLAFSAGIIVWVLMKKWIFGGAGRI